MLNFANPNFLGSKNDFRKNFENAIIKGRDADASDAVKAESTKRLKDLTDLVTKFIIRRTNDLLSKYREYHSSFGIGEANVSCFQVPVKYEHVVFCTPSTLQVSLYQLFTKSDEIQTLLRGTGSQPLKAIDMLRKLCNTPQLLNLPEALHGCEKLLPEGFVGAAGDKSTARIGKTAGRSRGVNSYSGGTASDVHTEYSGKLAVLERFAIESWFLLI